MFNPHYPATESTWRFSSDIYKCNLQSLGEYAISAKLTSREIGFWKK